MKDLSLTLNWLMEQLPGAQRGNGLEALKRRKLAGISTDSRSLKPGEVFVALPGENFDGHRHAAEALQKGALALIVQKKMKGPAAELALKVPDTLKALGDLALALRLRQGLKLAAVTGSNGKTGTKEMLAAILGLMDENILATRGNFNNLVGLPLTLFSLKKAARLAVLEMGMNHFGELSRLTEIARPDVGLITTVGPAHLEFFGTVSRVAKAKGEIFEGLPPSAVAVVNADEPLIVREARRFSGNKLFFGASPSAQVRLGRLSLKGLSGQGFTLYGPGAEKGRAVRLKLLGTHNAHNALAAAAAALAMGADWDRIVQGLESVESFPGRLSLLKLKWGLQVLDDSYNANPGSMAAGLKVLAEAGGRRPKGAILGDMGELGAAEGTLHRQMGRLAAGLGLDFLALVGPQSRLAALAARRAGLNKAAVAEFESPEEAAEWVWRTRPGKSTVLIKGSRSAHMERAVEYLKNV